jgi:hypothetical protein
MHESRSESFRPQTVGPCSSGTWHLAPATGVSYGAVDVAQVTVFAFRAL